MGEGRQHDDGQSHVLSSTVPCCVSYDPTFTYELAVIIQDAMRRMYVDNETSITTSPCSTKTTPTRQCPKVLNRTFSRACIGSRLRHSRSKAGMFS